MVRMAPPPTPWTLRPPIAMAMFCEAAVMALPRAKRRMPPIMTGRRPKMAARPPAAGARERGQRGARLEQGEGEGEDEDVLQGMSAVEVRA